MSESMGKRMPGVENSLRDIFSILFRHKWKLTLSFCAVMVIVTLVTFLTPKSFQSDAKIMVRVGRESVTLDPTATTGQVISVGQSREIEVKSELEILRSRELVEKVVDAIGPFAFLKGSDEGGSAFGSDKISLSGGIVELFRRLSPASAAGDREKAILDFVGSLKIEALKNSNIISISFEARNRKLAQESIEKLISFYLDKHINVHRTAGSYEFFTKQTEQFRNSLAQAEETLRQLKNKTGIASLEEQRRILLKRIGNLQHQAESAESALAASKMKVQSMDKTLAELPETSVTQETTGNANQGVDLMRSKLYELQLKEQDLLSRYTEESKAVKEIRRQIAGAKTLLEREEPTRTQVTKGINEAYRQVQLALLSEKAVLSSLQGKGKELQSQRTAARRDLETVNDNEIELAHMQREVNLQEASYRKYYEKLEQARIDQALEIGKISNISVVQPPTYPVKPVRPRTMLNLALGLFFGILGGIGLAFFSDYMDHSFKRAEDVEEKLNLPTLAAIPRSEEGFDRRGGRKPRPVPELHPPSDSMGGERKTMKPRPALDGIDGELQKEGI